MPHGLRRFQQSESLHFITFSCYHRLPYLTDPESKSLVLTLLEQTRARHQARIYGYVLMPDHIHLLINEPPVTPLDQLLKAFKQSTSHHLKGNRPHFWQTRYYDKNIHGEEARLEVLHYIHLNPVKRGLVSDPASYPWSSAHHYQTGTPAPVELESDYTARLRNQLP
jgi:putative transposase